MKKLFFSVQSIFLQFPFIYTLPNASPEKANMPVEQY